MPVLRLTALIAAVTALLAAAYIGIQSHLGIPSDTFKARYDAGLAHLNAGDFPAAIDDLKHALDMNPGSVAAMHKLGWAYIRNREFEAGESYQLKALELAPNCAICAFKIGTSRMQQHDFAASAEWYGKSVVLKPEWALARYYHALALHAVKQTDAALDEVRTALKLDPTLGPAEKLLARLEAK